MRMLIGGIFVGAIAVLAVVRILVYIRADSRRMQLRAQEWEHGVDERLKKYRESW